MPNRKLSTVFAESFMVLIAAAFILGGTASAEPVMMQALPPAPEQPAAAAAAEMPAAPMPSGSIEESGNFAAGPLSPAMAPEASAPLPELPENVFAEEPIEDQELYEHIAEEMQNTIELMEAALEAAHEEAIDTQELWDLGLEAFGDIHEFIENYAAWIDEYFEEHPEDPMHLRDLIESIQLEHDIWMHQTHPEYPEMPDAEAPIYG